MNNEILQEALQKISELNNLVVEITQNQYPSQIDTTNIDNVPEMLTIKEAVEQFPYLSDFTLRKWIREDKIKSYKIGDGRNARYIIKKSDLQKMFE